MKSVYNFFVSIPIFVSLVICLIFVGVGVYETFLGISGILRGMLHTTEYVGLRFIDALDLFLISFLFLIFSLGFSQLFLVESKLSQSLGKITPKWLHVSNFTQLKLILWETILTTMIIMFVASLLKNGGKEFYEYIIYPVGIVLIALSGFFIRKGEKLHE